MSNVDWISEVTDRRTLRFRFSLCLRACVYSYVSSTSDTVLKIHLLTAACIFAAASVIRCFCCCLSADTLIAVFALLDCCFIRKTSILDLFWSVRVCSSCLHKVCILIVLLEILVFIFIFNYKEELTSEQYDIFMGLTAFTWQDLSIYVNLLFQSKCG